MRLHGCFLVLAAVSSALAAFPTVSEAGLIGPASYLCFDQNNTNSSYEATYTGSCGTSGSVFAADAIAGNFSYFHLENFEDALLNAPGVTSSAGIPLNFGSIRDSVDSDGGAINGNGLAQFSFFSTSGTAGINFTFNAAILGQLPTHAGIVWTDGAGSIDFRAYDQNGDQIGSGLLGNIHADGAVNGGTAEDRFYGVTNLGGISRIYIRNTAGGIEVDHLQFGLMSASVPEPGALILFALGIFGLMLSSRQRYCLDV